MRQIKFRAWDKEANIMVYSDHRTRKLYDVYYGFEMNGEGELECWWEGEFTESYVLDRGILDNLMQYTGLKDKNGTEIYEGDIVNFQRTFKCPMDGKTMRNINVNKEITFDSGKFGYLLNKGITAIDSKVLNMEVIGNIYENPELLENER